MNNKFLKRNNFFFISAKIGARVFQIILMVVHQNINSYLPLHFSFGLSECMYVCTYNQFQFDDNIPGYVLVNQAS